MPSRKIQALCFQGEQESKQMEIKKAVEGFYGVTVIDVNTTVVPGKQSRSTKQECPGPQLYSHQ